MQKLSLANVIGKLTRSEMRSVMAGSGSSTAGSECNLTITEQGNTYVWKQWFVASTYAGVSSAANAACVEIIQNGATRCTYDCAYDGYGS